MCNGYQNLLMSMNLSDIAILNIKGADYCCITSGISKAINLVLNINLTKTSGTLLIIKFITAYKNGWRNSNVC